MPNAYIGAFSLHVQYGSNFAESLGFPTLPTLNCEVATSKEGHKSSINQLSNCLCPLYDRIRGAATSPTRRWLESGCKRWICGDRSTVQRHGGYTFTSSLRISPSQLSTGRICLFLLLAPKYGYHERFSTTPLFLSRGRKNQLVRSFHDATLLTVYSDQASDGSDDTIEHVSSKSLSPPHTL